MIIFNKNQNLGQKLDMNCVQFQYTSNGLQKTIGKYFPNLGSISKNTTDWRWRTTAASPQLLSSTIPNPPPSRLSSSWSCHHSWLVKLTIICLLITTTISIILPPDNNNNKRNVQSFSLPSASASSGNSASSISLIASLYRHHNPPLSALFLISKNNQNNNQKRYNNNNNNNHNKRYYYDPHQHYLHYHHSENSNVLNNYYYNDNNNNNKSSASRQHRSTSSDAAANDRININNNNNQNGDIVGSVLKNIQHPSLLSLSSLNGAKGQSAPQRIAFSSTSHIVVTASDLKQDKPTVVETVSISSVSASAATDDAATSKPQTQPPKLPPSQQPSYTDFVSDTFDLHKDEDFLQTIDTISRGKYCTSTIQHQPQSKPSQTQIQQQSKLPTVLASAIPPSKFPVPPQPQLVPISFSHYGQSNLVAPLSPGAKVQSSAYIQSPLLSSSPPPPSQSQPHAEHPYQRTLHHHHPKSKPLSASQSPLAPSPPPPSSAPSVVGKAQHEHLDSPHHYNHHHHRYHHNHRISIPISAAKVDQFRATFTNNERCRQTAKSVDLLANVLAGYEPEKDNFAMLIETIHSAPMVEQNIYRLSIVWRLNDQLMSSPTVVSLNPDADSESIKSSANLNSIPTSQSKSSENNSSQNNNPQEQPSIRLRYYHCTRDGAKNRQYDINAGCKLTINEEDVIDPSVPITSNSASSSSTSSTTSSSSFAPSPSDQLSWLPNRLEDILLKGRHCISIDDRDGQSSTSPPPPPQTDQLQNSSEWSDVFFDCNDLRWFVTYHALILEPVDSCPFSKDNGKYTDQNDSGQQTDNYIPIKIIAENKIEDESTSTTSSASPSSSSNSEENNNNNSENSNNSEQDNVIWYRVKGVISADVDVTRTDINQCEPSKTNVMESLMRKNLLPIKLSQSSVNNPQKNENGNSQPSTEFSYYYYYYYNGNQQQIEQQDGFNHNAQLNQGYGSPHFDGSLLATKQLMVLNLFGTHKCHKENSWCEFQPGNGMFRGGYQCKCKDGFHSLFSNLTFNGSLMEQSYQDKHDGINPSYDYLYYCKRCAPGCDVCVNEDPCLSTYNWAFRISLLTITILCIIFVFIIAFNIYRYRKLKVIKVASPIFLCITLLGCSIMYSECVAIFPVLEVWTCVLTKWTRNFGFCLTYSALLLKTWRVSLTYRVKSAHKIKLTDKQLLQWLFPILLVMAIYLAAWTISDTPQTVYIVDWNNLKFKQCDYNWWDHSLTIGEFFFLLWGIKVCYNVRNAESLFNEAKYITWAIYNITMVNIIMILLHVFILPNSGPDIKYFFGFVRTQMSTTTTVILIFGPKFYRVIKGQGDLWDNQIRARGIAASFSFNGVGLAHEETTDLYQENEELKEEIQKLAAQLEIMKLSQMEFKNRHLAGSKSFKQQQQQLQQQQQQYNNNSNNSNSNNSSNNNNNNNTSCCNK